MEYLFQIIAIPLGREAVDVQVAFYDYHQTLDTGLVIDRELGHHQFEVTPRYPAELSSHPNIFTGDWSDLRRELVMLIVVQLGLNSGLEYARIETIIAGFSSQAPIVEDIMADFRDSIPDSVPAEFF